MSKQAKVESLRSSINNERESAMFEGFENISVSRIIIEMFIGFIWGYTLGIAANCLITAFMLLGLPVFFNLVVYFALLALTVYIAVRTAAPVAAATYNVCAAGASVAAEAGKRTWDFVSTSAVSLKQKYAA